MRTLITEIRRLNLASKNQISLIENRKNRMKEIESQLNLMYGNPNRFHLRIGHLEGALAMMRAR